MSYKNLYDSLHEKLETLGEKLNRFHKSIIEKHNVYN